MSESDEEEFLNCYSTISIKKQFRKQVSNLKQSEKLTSNQEDAGNEPLENLIVPTAIDKPPSLLPNNCQDVTEKDDSVKADGDGTAARSSEDSVPTTPESNPIVPPAPASPDPEVSIISDFSPLKNRIPVKDNNAIDDALPLSQSDNQSADRLRLTEDDIIILSDSPPTSKNTNTDAEPKTTCRRSKRLQKLNPQQPTLDAYFLGPKKTRGSRSSRRAVRRRGGKIEEVVLDNDPLDDEVPDDDINYECNVKIVWKSANVVKIPVRRLQKLNVVFEHFMKLEDVSIDKILLMLHGKTIKPTDTPETLNLGVVDFLEGGVVNTNISYTSSASSSKFVLKFQRPGAESVTLPIKCQDKLKTALLGYAEQVDMPLSQLKFLFDGIPIHFNDTPESLEMENNDVIDVVIVN